MSKEKDKLFSLIKEKVPANVLLIDQISDVLNISYDASYRRVVGKTSLSFKEALQLAKYYKISLSDMDGLNDSVSKEIFKNTYLKSSKGVVDFYKDITSCILRYVSDSDSKIYYAAKGIPIYHIPTETLYNKFKMYVYLSFSAKKNNEKTGLFSDFVNSENFKKETERFNTVISQVPIVDVWSDTTINSCLQTIYYFYKTKLLTNKESLLLCNEMFHVVKNIEKKAEEELWNKEKGLKYELYHSKLMSLNQTLLLKSDAKKEVLMPYANLSHMRIKDIEVTNEVEAFFKKQLQVSVKISGKDELQRTIFFTLMYEKIEHLKNQIMNKSKISFM